MRGDITNLTHKLPQLQRPNPLGYGYPPKVKSMKACNQENWLGWVDQPTKSRALPRQLMLDGLRRAPDATELLMNHSKIASDKTLMALHGIKNNNENSDKMIILKPNNHHHNSTNGPRTEIEGNKQVYHKTQPNSDKTTPLSANLMS